MVGQEQRQIAKTKWKSGQPPKDGVPYLCWCRFSYGSPRTDYDHDERPVVLSWKIDNDDPEGHPEGGYWKWEEQEIDFWGEILAHCYITEYRKPGV